MPKTFVLTNGKTVIQPSGKTWIYFSVVVGFFIFCMFFIPIDFFAIRLGQTFKILKMMFSPDEGDTWWDYFAYTERLVEPILETLSMSFGGTVIGAVASLPLAFLAARNVVKKPGIYQSARLIMNFVRTIPVFVIAVIASFFFGIGVLPGIAAIAVFTFGIMTKMLYEAIETVDMGPFEALEANGANKIIAFRYAIFPQIVPIYLSYFIYTFEINVRSSVVLGFVGAGGIGVVISENIGFFYERVGMAIIVLFALVIGIQSFSSYVRGKLQ